jgi:hypothetical protein
MSAYRLKTTPGSALHVRRGHCSNCRSEVRYPADEEGNRVRVAGDLPPGPSSSW